MKLHQLMEQKTPNEKSKIAAMDIMNQFALSDEDDSEEVIKNISSIILPYFNKKADLEDVAANIIHAYALDDEDVEEIAQILKKVKD